MRNLLPLFAAAALLAGCADPPKPTVSTTTTHEVVETPATYAMMVEEQPTYTAVEPASGVPVTRAQIAISTPPPPPRAVVTIQPSYPVAVLPPSVAASPPAPSPLSSPPTIPVPSPVPAPTPNPLQEGQTMQDVPVVTQAPGKMDEVALPTDALPFTSPAQ